MVPTPMQTTVVLVFYHILIGPLPIFCVGCSCCKDPSSGFSCCKDPSCKTSPDSYDLTNLFITSVHAPSRINKIIVAKQLNCGFSQETLCVQYHQQCGCVGSSDVCLVTINHNMLLGISSRHGNRYSPHTCNCLVLLHHCH